MSTLNPVSQNGRFRPATASNSKAPPSALPHFGGKRADSTHFGETKDAKTQTGHQDTPPDDSTEKDDKPGLLKRLKGSAAESYKRAFVWNDGTKKCVKADFIKSLWITFWTLPLALVLPGSHLLFIPFWMGYKMAKRGYQGAKAGYHNPAITQNKP
jgi:hypothetical protein